MEVKLDMVALLLEDCMVSSRVTDRADMDIMIIMVIMDTIRRRRSIRVADIIVGAAVVVIAIR